MPPCFGSPSTDSSAVILREMARMPKKRTFDVSGWVGDYWLATTADLKRLVPKEPKARHSDCHSIRWKLVAHVASDVLRAARVAADAEHSAARLAAWDVSVEVAAPEPLTNDEAMIVDSLFSEPAVADRGSRQVVNGRHRMWFSCQSGAAHLPVQSNAVSYWSHALFGDPECTTLERQIFECAHLFGFRGQCQTWRKRPGADVGFIDGLADAVEIAEDFLDAIAVDAARFDPSPRRMARS
jgi:hypothetical protein